MSALRPVVPNPNESRIAAAMRLYGNGSAEFFAEMRAARESSGQQFVIAGKKFEHNGKHWEVRTNRHSNTDGTSWGWIEGTDATWSNNERFNRAAAFEAVQFHNDWLEQQKPLSVQIIEAREKHKRLSEEFDYAHGRFEKAKFDLSAASVKLASLLDQSGKATGEQA